MATINLRDLYPEEQLDCFIEVPDGGEEAFKASLTKEIADVYFDEQRRENAYKRRVYWNKAHYSLDQGDGIENDVISKTADPFDLLMEKLTNEQLLAAIDGLPEKQGKRIYEKFILGISQADIARAEGVAESAVNQAIERGLRNLEKILKKFL